MGASAVSVFENNKALRVTIHIFTDGYSLENLEKTKQLAQHYKGRIIVYTLNMDVFADFHIKVVRFSRITYGRLVMPKVLENVVDRYVYIDADAICVQSLESLLDLNLGLDVVTIISKSGISFFNRYAISKERLGLFSQSNLLEIII